jgi:hypothetical protein
MGKYNHVPGAQSFEIFYFITTPGAKAAPSRLLVAFAERLVTIGELP